MLWQTEKINQYFFLIILQIVDIQWYLNFRVWWLFVHLFDAFLGDVEILLDLLDADEVAI